MLRETWTILPSHDDLRFMGGADASRDIDGFGGLRTIIQHIIAWSEGQIKNPDLVSQKHGGKCYCVIL
jgi:hypothetical protein